VLLVGVSVLATNVWAATPPPMSDAQAAAAFGKRDQVIDASLSPDGGKVALVVPGPGQATPVEVVDVATGNASAIQYAEGNPLAITGCGWASNQRIVCTEYGVADLDGRRLLAYLRLAAMNADGSDVIALGAHDRFQAYAQQSDGYVVDWRDGRTGKVLIARTYVPSKSTPFRAGDTRQGLGVDLVDTATGKADLVESPNPYAQWYLSDGQGRVRMMATDESLRHNMFSKGTVTFSYRLPGDDDWKPFSTYDRMKDEGLYPIAVDGKNNVAYALKKTAGRDALYRVALDGSMTTTLAYANPKVDVSGVVRVGREGHVVGARYITDQKDISYFDPQYEQMAGALAKALPATPLINLIDSSADGTKHLIYASSDVDPGRYYFFDAGAKRLMPLALDRPDLAGVAMGHVKSISYPAADGTVIPAYLTLPPGSDGKNLPAIVMPHGGPASRDEWGFDWLAQFFVNRGFAVIQPEYRGSTGYGDEWFNDNGFHSWKTAIGDVTDAGRWLIKQGIADPAKLAIVGWSYGGYAALQSNVLDPDLFKAVVAIAPVTDLGMLRGESKGFIDQRVALKEIGDDDAVIEAGSPARHAAVFKAPVLMFQGSRDINVDAKEAAFMNEQLEKAGKSSRLVAYPNIDHQLRDSTVRTDMWTKAEAFLEKSLQL
jgi:acetyl esterase/lipase